MKKINHEDHEGHEGRNMYNIELTIEELVLDGFSPHHRYRIAEAVKNDLARLILEQGFSSLQLQDSVIDRLNGGKFEVHADTKPKQIGTKIAQAVYGGLYSGGKNQ